MQLQAAARLPTSSVSEIAVNAALAMTGAVFFDMEAHSPWVGTTPSASVIAGLVMPEAEHVICFHVLTAGACWAELADGSLPPVRLGAGDVVVISKGDAHYLCSSRGMRGDPDMAAYRRPASRPLPMPHVLNETAGGPETCHFVCGYLGCDLRPFNPLLDGLPRLFHARASTASRAWLSNLIDTAVEETDDGGAGREVMLAKLAELMFVDMLRSYIGDLPEDLLGWLSGLRDRHVGAALQLIHGRPAQDWTLETLPDTLVYRDPLSQNGSTPMSVRRRSNIWGAGACSWPRGFLIKVPALRTPPLKSDTNPKRPSLACSSVSLELHPALGAGGRETSMRQRLGEVSYAFGAVQKQGKGRSASAPPQLSDLDLFGDRQGVVNFNAEIPNRALDLRVAEQQLDSPQVACLSIDERCLCSAQRMRPEERRIESYHRQPLAEQPRVLASRQMTPAPLPSKQEITWHRSRRRRNNSSIDWRVCSVNSNLTGLPVFRWRIVARSMA